MRPQVAGEEEAGEGTGEAAGAGAGAVAGAAGRDPASPRARQSWTLTWTAIL